MFREMGLGPLPSVSHYLLGNISVAGVVTSSDGLLKLVLVASDDDVSLSGVASGAISRSASATIKKSITKLSVYFSLKRKEL